MANYCNELHITVWLCVLGSLWMQSSSLWWVSLGHWRLSLHLWPNQPGSGTFLMQQMHCREHSYFASLCWSEELFALWHTALVSITWDPTPGLTPLSIRPCAMTHTAWGRHPAIQRSAQPSETPRMPDSPQVPANKVTLCQLPHFQIL